jgi:hypothetical protein
VGATPRGCPSYRRPHRAAPTLRFLIFAEIKNDGGGDQYQDHLEKMEESHDGSFGPALHAHNHDGGHGSGGSSQVGGGKIQVGRLVNQEGETEPNEYETEHSNDQGDPAFGQVVEQIQGHARPDDQPDKDLSQKAKNIGTDISQMTSFLPIPNGQNAINSGKHCQAGFAYCRISNPRLGTLMVSISAIFIALTCKFKWLRYHFHLCNGPEVNFTDCFPSFFQNLQTTFPAFAQSPAPSKWP